MSSASQSICCMNRDQETLYVCQQPARYISLHIDPSIPGRDANIQKRHLMLRRDSLTSKLLDSLLCNIAQRNHADRLPNAESDPRGDTPVQSLDTVLLVNVLERATHAHLLRAVWILGLALHLDPDDLDGLVPGTETTAQRRRQDLLRHAQFLPIFLARRLPDPRLRNATEAEARPPVGDLADGDGVDATVDTPDTLAAVDVHERRHRAWWLHARRRNLVLGDFDRLHAGAEAHGCVGLGQTADHAASDASDEAVGAEAASVVLGLGGDEEEDGAFGGGFDPSPGDQPLVDCRRRSVSTNQSMETAKTTRRRLEGL